MSVFSLSAEYEFIVSIESNEPNLIGEVKSALLINQMHTRVMCDWRFILLCLEFKEKNEQQYSVTSSDVDIAIVLLRIGYLHGQISDSPSKPWIAYGKCSV